MREYVILPSENAAVAVALWVAATHGQRAWQHAPRLVINGPTKRCGKSRLMDVVYEACHDPLMTVNATVAAIFRSITADPPTLLVDEADTIFGTAKVAEQNEDLRGLLNAGHQRGRDALRVVGRDAEQKPKKFPTFAMAALAGIGAMPDTIMDRAIIVTMRRRAPGEKVKPFRTRRDAPRFQAIGQALAEWLRGATDELADAEPLMPVEDRAADTWEPLIVVADLAGGTWPERARRAAFEMSGEREKTDVDTSYRARVLIDCRKAFAAAGDPNALPTDRLLVLLHADPEAPWADWGREGLTAKRLGDLLGDYGIRSSTIRFPEGQKKGYLRIKFTDAWDRYCPPDTAPTADGVADGDREAASIEPRRYEGPSHPSHPSPSRSTRDGSQSRYGSTRTTDRNRPGLTSGYDHGTDGTDIPEKPPATFLVGPDADGLMDF